MIPRLRGMRDLLPPTSTLMTRVLNIFRELAELQGYMEVVPPTLELFDLFALKSGEEIKNTMYVFKDKAGRVVALRPEVTASIARMFVQELQQWPRPVRVYYIANCFRYEEPQRGRYREFTQAGVELLGVRGPLSDAETILLLDEFYRRLGLETSMIVGHVGVYRDIMSSEGVPEEVQDKVLWLIDKGEREEALREACKYASNPDELRKVLEVLSTLVTDKEHSEILDEAYKALTRYRRACEELNDLRLLMSLIEGATWSKVTLNLGFARGLAYYTGVIYEVKTPVLGVSIAGGGRYDTLIKLYGGPDTPAVGFAVGVDRTILALEEAGLADKLCPEPRVKVLVVPLVEEAYKTSLMVSAKLRRSGVIAVLELRSRSLKKTIAHALSQGFTHVVLIGKRELAENVVSVRDVRRAVQKKVDIDDVVSEVLGGIG